MNSVQPWWGNGFADLIDLDFQDREHKLKSVGFSDEIIGQVETAIQAMPQVTMSAQLFVEDETEIMQKDTVTCKVTSFGQQQGSCTFHVNANQSNCLKRRRFVAKLLNYMF